MEIEEAVNALTGAVTPIKDRELLPLREAFGRILAEGVKAPFSVPSFPKSAMDGYAVRSADVADASGDAPVRLKVSGELLAGEAFSKAGRKGTDTAGTAFRVMTGAEVPAGYDAVVRQEDTDRGEEEVSVYRSVSPYMNYCRVGEDIREGEEVLSAGSRIGRIEAGVLASLGLADVSVLRRIKVHIISTGTELTEPGSALTEGKIYNSIAYTLEAALTDSCYEVSSEICGDERDGIKTALEAALKDSDVVMTTGGVSVGKADLLPEVLESIGAVKLFSRVNIQPGTPTIGSVKDGKAILSLSGNPYAAVANFDIYFPELAAKLTGCGSLLPVTEKAVLDSPYEKVNHMRRLLRAKYRNGRVNLPVKSHASSVLSNLLECNCYIDLPAGTAVSPGDTVTVRIM